jgi:folate-dependent phosphoribosylglycinamide formyltransferase PurN
MSKPWVAFISRSGKELEEICNQLGIYPNYIFTNNLDLEINELNARFKFRSNIIQGNPKFLYEQLKHVVFNEAPLITLNGYLRVVPKELVEQYQIVNGHPGDILTWPVLKGLDPQKKAIELGLSTTCCVIHEVTEGVDEGEVLMQSPDRNITQGITEQQLSDYLREDSIKLWVNFLADKLNVESYDKNLVLGYN